MAMLRVLFVVLLALGPGVADAQQTLSAAPPRASGPAAAAELKLVAEGWALLSQGNFEGAAGRAAAAAQASPRSAAALTLGLEVEIARTNALAGLDFYERWLGTRTMEEPAVVRRIAQAVLRELAASPDSLGRHAALVSLAADGDPDAKATLADPAAPGGAETRALAALGNEAAIDSLIADLNAGGAGGTRTIEALGKSRSPRAVEPLTASLTNPRPEVRGAAVEALGRIGGPDAAARLRLMLSDQSSFVRVRAAGALLRLDDPSGMPVLQETLAASQSSPAGRLIVAEAMASRPNAEWQSLVKELTQASEPEIRLSAAVLIAPHDPMLARSILEALASDRNPAIREEAGRALAREVAGDLRTLRALLRNADSLTRANAAGRILELTR